MEITNRNTFDPLATSTALMILTYQLYEKNFKWLSGGMLINYLDMIY